MHNSCIKNPSLRLMSLKGAVEIVMPRLIWERKSPYATFLLSNATTLARTSIFAQNKRTNRWILKAAYIHTYIHTLDPCHLRWNTIRYLKPFWLLNTVADYLTLRTFAKSFPCYFISTRQLHPPHCYPSETWNPSQARYTSNPHAKLRN